MKHRRFPTPILILAAAMLLSGVPLSFTLSVFPSHAWGGSPGNDEASVEESVEFYQYTDREGVIHFADTIENIPKRYRGAMIVRKERTEARKTTEIRIADNQVHVPVSFRNGKRMVEAVLILDTGASITCINRGLAARLGIEPASARVVSMAMADGSMVEIRVTKVDSLTVGDRMRSPFEIGILPRQLTGKEHEGYLGLDFLSGFPHRIDFRNSLIRWE